jgi:putative transposase
VDTLGLIIAIVVHEASVQDRDGAKLVLEHLRKGLHILPRRWVVERTFGWLGRYRRLAKDYEQRTDNSEAMICAGSPGIGQSPNFLSDYSQS